MKPLRAMSRWWKVLFRRASTEAELDDEIQLHLEMETAKNIRGGMPADLARRESRDDLETVHSCQGEWLAQERLEEEHR